MQVRPYRPENRLSATITEEQISQLEHVRFACFEPESELLEEEIKRWLKTYRTYIGQAPTQEEHQERISRMVTFTAEQDDSVLIALGKDKFFFQAWFKYAESVQDTEDVFDYILEKKIGSDFATCYIKIAEYIEMKAKDMRKAEVILRNGYEYLASRADLSKELARLELANENFCRRVSKDKLYVNKTVKSHLNVKKRI